MLRAPPVHNLGSLHSGMGCSLTATTDLLIRSASCPLDSQLHGKPAGMLLRQHISGCAEAWQTDIPPAVRNGILATASMVLDPPSEHSLAWSPPGLWWGWCAGAGDGTGWGHTQPQRQGRSRVFRRLETNYVKFCNSEGQWLGGAVQTVELYVGKTSFTLDLSMVIANFMIFGLKICPHHICSTFESYSCIRLHSWE